MNTKEFFSFSFTTFRKHGMYLLASFLFIFLTNLGQINFALHTPAGYEYTGANTYAALDKLVYMNMIEQGREGHLLMRNTHTTDPQKYSMVSPLWYIIGQTGAVFNVSNNVVYQLYRVLFAVLFCWLLYLLLKQLFSTEVNRLMAALCVFFSGGFGWFYLLKNPWLLQAPGLIRFFNEPIDLYVTEGTTLLNFSQAPLFSFSQVALLFSAYVFVRHRDRISWKWDISNACMVALLGFMHPYDIPIVFAVLGSWAVWHVYTSGTWVSFKRLAIVGIGGVVAMGYNLYSLMTEPVLSTWYQQNLVYSPPVVNYVWGYGLLLVLGALGIVILALHKRKDPWWALVWIWCMIVPVLLYLPLDVSRRFINGWHIVLALTAYYGARFLYRVIRHTWLHYTYAAIVAVALASSLGLFIFINLYFEPAAYAYGYYYVTPDEQRIIAFLRANTTVTDRFLTSDMITSFTLTGQLDRLVFRGHDHQTPESMLKQEQMDWFFADPTTTQSIETRRLFLSEYQFQYIVVNTQRVQRPVQWLTVTPFVEKVFSSGSWSIYRVKS